MVQEINLPITLAKCLIDMFFNAKVVDISSKVATSFFLGATHTFQWNPQLHLIFLKFESVSDLIFSNLAQNHIIVVQRR